MPLLLAFIQQRHRYNNELIFNLPASENFGLNSGIGTENGAGGKLEKIGTNIYDLRDIRRHD